MSQAGVARDRMTLSVVVHVTGREDAAALDETFFSLAIQDWRDLEVVVAPAGGGDEVERRVVEAVESQPWPAAPRYKLLPAGAAVTRGALLNRGIGEASGRFLTFVDAGEVVVYQHGYAALAGRLAESGGAFAVGGCRSVHVRGEAGRQYVVTKDDFTLGRSPLDLIRRKPAPLCAHIIDRTRVGEFALSFDESPRADEREFLARLYAASAPDFTRRHVFVCERRLRAGGLGGMLYAAARRGYAWRARLRRMKARLLGVGSAVAK